MAQAFVGSNPTLCTYIMAEGNNAKTNIILGFGTSSLYGAWDEQGGWFERLRTYYDSKYASDQSYYSIFYNLGIAGNTTSDILKRFRAESSQRSSKIKSENIVIFDLGKNDAALLIESNRNRVPPQKFADNIRKLCALSSKISSTTLFLGILPLVQDAGAEYMKWTPDLYYSKKNIFEYDKILEQISKTVGAGYIDLKKAFADQKPDKVLEDGLHMNSLGHEIVSKTVIAFLSKNRILG